MVAEARAGLVQIDQTPAPSSAMRSQATAHQIAAIAIGGAEDISADAVRLHAHQHVLAAGDFAVHQREVAFAVDGAGGK